MKKTIPYALFTGAALIAYFLIMKLLGLETNFYLRIFNFVIMTGGIYLLYRHTFKQGRSEHVGYLQALLMGAKLTTIAVVVFIIFLAAYIKLIDPSFVKVLDNAGIWSLNGVSLIQAMLGILIEGLASGYVISFVLMQFFKSSIPSRDSA